MFCGTVETGATTPLEPLDPPMLLAMFSPKPPRAVAAPMNANGFGVSYFWLGAGRGGLRELFEYLGAAGLVVRGLAEPAVIVNLGTVSALQAVPRDGGKNAYGRWGWSVSEFA